MARFEVDRYLEYADEELKAAKLMLALSVTPLLFFLSTLGYVGDLSLVAKIVISLSMAFFAVAVGLWGLATAIGQISLVPIKFERAKKVEGEQLEAFVEKTWQTHNDASAKLFRRAAIPLVIGLVGLAIFVTVVIWS